VRRLRESRRRPNQIETNSSARTLDHYAALEAAERGKNAMACQMYKIKQEIADGDRATLDVKWVGMLAVPFGSIPSGAVVEKRGSTRVL